MEEKIRFKKIAKMTVTDHNLALQLQSFQFSVMGILALHQSNKLLINDFSLFSNFFTSKEKLSFDPVNIH
jgi:hypothetical protein